MSGRSVTSRPVDRRRFITGFLIAGPTLAIAARIGLADGAGAFPTRRMKSPTPRTSPTSSS